MLWHPQFLDGDSFLWQAFSMSDSCFAFMECRIDADHPLPLPAVCCGVAHRATFPVKAQDPRSVLQWESRGSLRHEYLDTRSVIEI